MLAIYLQIATLPLKYTCIVKHMYTISRLDMHIYIASYTYTLIMHTA